METSRYHYQGVSLPLKGVMFALALISALSGTTAVTNAGPAAHDIHDIHVAMIRFSDLPTAPPEATFLHPDQIHTFRRYNSAMCSTTAINISRFCCEPPRKLAHLGWRQGLTQSISNTSYGFVLCAVRFDSAKHAHLAFEAFTKPIRDALKHGAGISSVALPPVGQERFGYEGTDITYEQLLLRQDNAVVQIGAFKSYKGSNNHLIPTFIKVSRRIK